jgi:hypothetical protein
MDKLWKDNNFKRFLMYVVIIGFAIFLLVIAFFISKRTYEKMFAIPLFIFLISVVYKQSLGRLSYLTNKGILVGNLDYKGGFFPKNKAIFYIWSEIKICKIVYRLNSTPLGGQRMTFLNLKTNKGENSECLIFDPDGFIAAIKNIGKASLIAKDSKYR